MIPAMGTSQVVEPKRAGARHADVAPVVPLALGAERAEDHLVDGRFPHRTGQRVSSPARTGRQHRALAQVADFRREPLLGEDADVLENGIVGHALADRAVARERPIPVGAGFHLERVGAHVGQVQKLGAVPEGVVEVGHEKFVACTRGERRLAEGVDDGGVFRESPRAEARPRVGNGAVSAPDPSPSSSSSLPPQPARARTLPISQSAFPRSLDCLIDPSPRLERITGSRRRTRGSAAASAALPEHECEPARRDPTCACCLAAAGSSQRGSGAHKRRAMSENRRAALSTPMKSGLRQASTNQRS